MGPWMGRVRKNLREAIDRLVDLGYTVKGGQGDDRNSSIQAGRQWRHGAMTTRTLNG